MATPDRPRTAEIPASHRDLLTRPLHGVLSTIGAYGQPQSSLVWVDLVDGAAVVSTTLERQKGANMQANDKVSLLVVDPRDTSRYIQIRGHAVLGTAGAWDHFNALERKYTADPAFSGPDHPAARQLHATRVDCRILARRVTVDAIHADIP